MDLTSNINVIKEFKMFIEDTNMSKTGKRRNSLMIPEKTLVEAE